MKIVKLPEELCTLYKQIKEQQAEVDKCHARIFKLRQDAYALLQQTYGIDEAYIMNIDETETYGVLPDYPTP